VITAGLLVLALRRPLKGTVAGGQRVNITWRLPALSAAANFLRYAGPVAFVLLTKCFMYSASLRHLAMTTIFIRRLSMLCSRLHNSASQVAGFLHLTVSSGPLLEAAMLAGTQRTANVCVPRNIPT